MFEANVYGATLWSLGRFSRTDTKMSATLHIADILEIVGIPFTYQGQARVNDVRCCYMHYFETLRHSSAMLVVM